MAVIGTKVTREAPYPRGAQGQNRVVNTLTGAGADSTEVTAAVATKQLHVIGGFISISAAGTIQVLSNATVIAILPFSAAGVIPFPPVYAKAGEALKVDNADLKTVFFYVETEALVSGQYAPDAV